jgi:hypothetical protein
VLAVGHFLRQWLYAIKPKSVPVIKTSAPQMSVNQAP